LKSVFDYQMSPIASAGGGDAKRNIVAVYSDLSTTERRMAPPMESGKRQPIEPTDIMSQPIPKQKRFKIDGQRKRATNASDEPIRSFSHAATTSTTANSTMGETMQSFFSLRLHHCSMRNAYSSLHSNLVTFSYSAFLPSCTMLFAYSSLHSSLVTCWYRASAAVEVAVMLTLSDSR